MNEFRYVIYRLVLLLVLLLVLPTFIFARQADVPLLPLVQGWEVRVGDSPGNAAGLPQWIVSADSGWQPAQQLFTPLPGGQSHHLWLRVRLPGHDWQQPTLYLPAVHQAVQVFIDTELIYQSGELHAGANNKVAAVRHHLIPLKRSAQGKMMYLRLFSGMPGTIGVMNVGDQVLVGEQLELLKYLFIQDADTVLLGFLFIVIGAFTLFIFFRRLRQREWYVVSFGVFALLAGIFYLLQGCSSALLTTYPQVRYYLSFSAFLLFPVPMFAFFEQAVPSDDCRVIRRIWQMHLLAAVGFIFLDFFNWMHFHTAMQYYFFLFVLTICIMFAISWRAARKGSWQAKMFISGFAVMGLTGLNDLLIALGVLPFWQWTAHWGMFAFLLMLGYILERQFAENHRRLEAYSHELEFKTRKLDKYSQLLEQKVAERTRDLNEKNRQLESTLRQLTAMQNQMITQAKLASLGKLVAGVAHEVNNPIGAVQSAADVSGRCVRQIDQTMKVPQHNGAGGDHVGKYLRLLKENIRVIQKGSKRIAAIIQNLKSFVHLDEAPYQQIDLREGLERALRMLQGEAQERIIFERHYSEIPRIFCYPGELNQVFLNLLQNAIEAIDGNGKVVIGTRLCHPHVEVEIQDSGRGIPPEQLEQIFEIGFSGKSGRVRVGSGLFTAYNIIQKHGGRIEIKSEEGRGTRVWLRLPVHPLQQTVGMEQGA